MNNAYFSQTNFTNNYNCEIRSQFKHIFLLLNSIYCNKNHDSRLTVTKNNSEFYIDLVYNGIYFLKHVTRHTTIHFSWNKLLSINIPNGFGLVPIENKGLFENRQQMFAFKLNSMRCAVLSKLV